MILPALLLALTADLEVLSVTPTLTKVLSDETFAYTVRAKNNGPEAAEQVTAIIGVNALGVMKDVVAPAGWTCEGPLPRFGYSVSCTTPSLAAGAEAEFTLTLTAPQPLATPYRLGGSMRTASTDPKSSNNIHETAIALSPSPTHTEFSMTAHGSTFTIRNDGPHDATDLMTILTGTSVIASGDGWNCGPQAPSVVCTRGLLEAGATTTISTVGAAEARVRAEKTHDANGRNNTATTGTAKLKRRAIRP